MKIGSLDSKPVAAPTNGDAKATRTASEKSRGTAEESAKVQISEAGSQIAQAAADPSFDAAKVERIAQAIRDGQFQVNPEKIADKLIANAQDLLKRYNAN